MDFPQGAENMAEHTKGCRAVPAVLGGWGSSAIPAVWGEICCAVLKVEQFHIFVIGCGLVVKVLGVGGWMDAAVPSSQCGAQAVAAS